MSSIFFHIDVNSAFLSWTAVKLIKEGFGQDIREIPAIVGGDQESRHGIVVAKSIPAKKYGIETAEPVASAFKKCPTLISVPPEHDYYHEQSHALMDYLSSICPIIEQVSIDECYMLFDPIKDKYESPEACAIFIKDSVYEKFGFTVNVGISDRKVLAKMASDFEKPNKMHTLYSYEIQKKIWPLPVKELFMCGKSAQEKFRQMGITTIGELANADKALVESWMKSMGTMLWEFANGIDNSTVNPVREPVKGVGNSTTLSSDITKAEDAYQVLERLCQSVSKRLKAKNFVAESLSVEIKYATFQSVSKQKQLIFPINEVADLYKEACFLFDQLWTSEPIRLLGVRTTKLTDMDEPIQLNLFNFEAAVEEEEERIERDEKLSKLDEALTKMQNKYGSDIIKKGI